MDSVETYRKRLHKEIGSVEDTIGTYNQQVTSMTRRLEGLKRALELFDSEQVAITELLRAGLDGGGSTLDHERLQPRPAQTAASKRTSRKVNGRATTPTSSPKTRRK